MAATDLTDQTFFKLKVIGRNPVNTKSNHPRWDCVCECGNNVTMASGHLLDGTSKSCGCWTKVVISLANSTHRASSSPAYITWAQVKQRCLNPKHDAYHNYGGRGITVCERWRSSFENFLLDMGPRPSLQHSIDRADNDGNYEPGNCHWATSEEQNNNKRNSVYFVFNNEKLTAKQIAKKTGVNYSSLYWHLSKGRTVEYAVESLLKLKGN